MYLLAIIIHVADERREKLGGIAQLGERLNGIQEVSGSIPLISTKSTNRKVGAFFFVACNLKTGANLISETCAGFVLKVGSPESVDL